jgi:energy-coupling factor transport system substrate-specific component
MTWQLASFSILGLAIAGGFAWYERTRPDARIVALVGTLAAFAALGRIAFAALPNIKPTTDIVLIAGYALGGAPGFVVGAVAGLTSNFFFGQGPWTPWQMAAWGVAGIIGAGLARVPGRRIGRWPLAIVCFVVGYAFAAFQDVGDWVTYSDHSTAQLGVYVGKGTGFDVIHAVGCLVFALAFGPALARSLQRFNQRLHVVWGPVEVAVLPILLVVCGFGAVAVAGAPPARAGASPTGYLLAAQNRDGGYGAARGGASSELYAGWTALGLAAEGHNPQDVSRGGHGLITYIRAGVRSIHDVGSLERTILAVRAAGLRATSFGSVNLIAALQRDIRRDGSVSEQVNLTSFAVLALRSAGVSPSRSTLAWLIRQQDSDGGFNFATAGASSDVDDTGAALEALAGAPGAGKVRPRAVGYLRRLQGADGGFPEQSGGESNAQSTAFAIQGLIAAGTDPATLHRGGAVSPLRFLGSLTGSDGHVHYSRTSDQTPVWVTAQAAMALARRALPIAPVARASRPHHHAPAAHRASVRSAPRAASASHAPRAPGRHRTIAARPPHGTDWLPVAAGLLAALALAPLGST